MLEQEKVVRSASTLRIFILLFIGERDVRAGDYYFDSIVSLLKIARLITRGEFDVVPVKITIPGVTKVNEMAIIFISKFENINGE